MAIDIEKLKDSDYLVDLLVQMEDVLDSLDIYVFEHWIDGEIVEGPTVRRHWVSFCLLYPRRKMPDPRAALRLLKHGVKVEFSRVHRKEGKKKSDDQRTNGKSSPVGSTPHTLDKASPQAWMPGSSSDDNAQDSGDAKLAQPSKKKSDMHWLVKVTFPRRLLDQLEAADAGAYDDDVDADDVSDAKDDGLDDESAYTAGEQNPEAEGAMPQGSPMDDPMAQGGMPPPGGMPGGGNGF